MFCTSTNVAFLIICLCIHCSIQRKQTYEQSRYLESDDDESYAGDDDEPRPRRPAAAAAATAAPVTAAAATPAPACPPTSSRRLRPHQLSPGGTGIGGDDDWRVRVDWLLERGSVGLVTGSIATVSGGSPARTLRVLPTSSAVCDLGAVDTVTAAADHGCEVALSAGVRSVGVSSRGGGCLGDLVSDGAALRRSPGGAGNAHFGVTKAGELFYGYLDERLRQSGWFSQLIGGLGWLVRDGKNFVSESLLAECSPSRPVAGLAAAAAAPSARSAVGQKRNGDLALVQIVGRSGVAGMSLSSFSDLLIRLGLVSAINLEAGDSTAMVINGTLVGSPSASCGDSTAPLACLRPTAAILCVGRRGRPNTSTPPQTPTPPLTPVAASPSSALLAACPGGGAPCSQVGGRCDPDTGRCLCRPYFTGPECATRRCLCLNAGQCLPDSEACLCRPGYTGQLCERPCPTGFYGQDCRRVCVCAGGQSDACDAVNGTCPAGSLTAAKNESSLLRSIQRRLQGLGSINLALVTLSAVLTLSLLLNACLLVTCCRMRCRRGQAGSRAGAGGKRYQPMRQVPTGRESDSDPDAVM